jgi:Rha family phage regulatory protein
MKDDLFPETLLVSRDGDGRVYTDSLRVAEHFDKAHRHVLEKIRHLAELQSATFTESNFRLSEYLDPTGRRLPKYELTRDGFAMLGMTFTGQKAALFREDFLAAFRAMEHRLAAFKERESAALYAIRPRWKPIVAHPDMKRAALTELTGHKSPGSITACRRRMREVGLLAGSAA